MRGGRAKFTVLPCDARWDVPVGRIACAIVPGVSHHRTSPVTPVDPSPASRLPVLATCLVLVLAHTAFRAWAAFGAWFQEDDFEFLRYSREQPFSLDYLMEPHSGHLMPLGRVLIDLSVASGMFNWEATAAVTVLFQAAVGLSAFWMLKTLFGLRWGIVPPLVVFLFSAITMPATVWWAVAVNQLAQEIGLMCAVACWVIFERTGRRRWAVLVVACVLLALAADIRVSRSRPCSLRSPSAGSRPAPCATGCGVSYDDTGASAS